MDNILIYLRIYYKLYPDKHAEMLNSGSYQPKFIRRHVDKYSNIPIPPVSIGMLKPFILVYEEVCSEQYPYSIHNIPESVKQRSMKMVSEWMDRNWQELPSH